ncbi:MAG: DUF5655 domain-containing protein [Rubrivivax sp.]|nr:DUF5655 domain-containing protein [Rubrivivax sp.]
MADPQAATLTQLRNIQAKTGTTIAELHAVLAESGLVKTGERRALLMQRFKLGYGDANAVALLMGKPLPALDGATPEPVASQAGEALDAIYGGNKAPLRALHEAVMAVVAGLGDFEAAPKKAYISLRRKRQFAMIGPATREAIEIGLNARDLPAHARLKIVPPGGMCQATTRISQASEIDATLKGWLKQAFEAAG